jgi:acyl-[acyl-carrier-protein] desaturase
MKYEVLGKQKDKAESKCREVRFSFVPLKLVISHKVWRSRLTEISSMSMERIERKEVMDHLDKEIMEAIPLYLKPIEKIWQPTDFLPKSQEEEFLEHIKLLRSKAKNLSYDLIAVLVGDTITEEVLPTYETWLSSLKLVKEESDGGWNQWVRAWTAEENRHGDVLNRYLYLSGRVNMREMEISTQHLLADGFDVGTARDPYRSFIYTSFQELATNVSHRRVAQIAKQEGDDTLAKICGNVAADEARHASAYKSFVERIFKIDPGEMMIAFEDMMRKRIVMPAHFLRESGGSKGSSFTFFADAAQRIGVYTAADYVTILLSLIKEWEIETLNDLTDAGERARDYVMALPARLSKLAERISFRPSNHQFKWINA